MNTQTQLPPTDTQPSPLGGQTVIVGIDWADREHAVCLIDPHGRATVTQLPQSPEAIDEWAGDMAARFPGQTIAIAIEQSTGALVHALLKYEYLRIYPINPKQLARYREAVSPSGSKDDPADARLLAQFLQHYGAKLRPLKPDTAATRKLGRLTEIRRKIVDERTRLTLQLNSTLKQYFPQLIELCSKQPLLLHLLQRWPTLALLKRVHPKTLRAVLRAHHIANEERQTEFIHAVRDALPLTHDEAVVEPNALYAALLARQIQEFSRTIADLEKQIAAQTQQHPDQQIFRSLPGAGDALVPRLIVAFGTDRERFTSAEQMQCYTGIAPVTRQSGKSRHVSCRYACPKFLRQTFHEFADQARKWSSWSEAYYRQKRDNGCRHQAAVRALAFKWIRIMFHLWKTNSNYDERTYIDQLPKRKSPLVKFLNPA
jgi:transposase